MVHERGRLLTATARARQSAALVLFVCCVRVVGIPASKVGFLAVLPSFAVVGPVGAIPNHLLRPGERGRLLSGMLIALVATSSTARPAIWCGGPPPPSCRSSPAS
jgi:hypothetical protein